MKPNHTPRQVDPERFQSHELWLMSKKGIGERLVLSGDYRGADLSGADLREARIKANLRGANLSGARLNGADLEGAVLWDADLMNADLTGVTGLLPSSRTQGFYPLSGADLQGAKLPENVSEFPALANVISICKSAGALFLALLAGDAAIQLMALKTTDLQLVSNNGSIFMPILNTDLPTSTLFWFGPAVLLISYLTLLFYMQKLWELIASLPAVFPDGLLCTQKAYPWLATGMIGSYFPKLRARPRSLPTIERFLYTGLMYYLVPLSFVPMFCRYLAAHDWRGTSIQVAIIWLCVFYWWVFVALARAIMSRNTAVLRGVRGALTLDTFWPKLKLLLHAGAVASTCGGIALLAAYYGPFSGERPLNRVSQFNSRPWSLRKIVPNILTFCELTPFVNLGAKELSKRPVNWVEDSNPEIVIFRADLKGRDLRYGDLQNAFAVNGDLQGAKLEYSNLSGADLRGANLSGTNATGATFTRTLLQRADLSGANLEDAQMSSTNLGGANLTNTNLNSSMLSLANLREADIHSANLDRANLQHADLRFANLSWVRLTHGDLRSANLRYTVMKGADLSGANLKGAVFTNAVLSGAKYSLSTQFPALFRPAKHGMILVP